ncbi:MAG: amino acid permease [Candidatus Omnitrophica bacterium]|nr:amino acid permease [Candidatus Omnitrophota bacterium]
MKLKKELNLLDVFCIASGAMISSGLFILPGLACAQAGPGVFVSYMLAGLLATTGMLSQAEMVSAMPKAGGTYFYIARSLGPAVGTVDGLLSWFAISLKSAFALIGMSAFTAMLIHVDIHIISFILCLFFVIINILGAKEASKIQIGLVAGLFLVLLLYVVRGLPAIQIQNFEPFAPYGIKAIFSTAGFVFVSYGGLLKVASIAEEVKDPARTVPLGMILSLFVTGIFYVLVVMVTTGVLGVEALSVSLTPINDGANAFMGNKGRIILGIAAILAFVSTANAGIMAASRYPLALARDGLLPDILMRVNKKFKTPHIAIIITGVFMVIALFLKLSLLVKLASVVLIMSFLLSCFSIIVLRESGLQNYQPQFRAPLYPWLQIVGIIGFGTMLFNLGKQPLMIALCMIIGGLFVYWFYGRIRVTREYALLHLIERITAEELTSRTLETELKEIIRERDDIAKDRFDQIVEKCQIMDLEHAMSMDDFFQLIANSLSESLKIEPKVLYDLLLKREQESTTVIAPGLAIPHIIIEGDHLFDIFLARSKKGIVFPDTEQSVNTVFVLIGSKDERNFHLKALAAIAQIVQGSNFSKKWLKAKNIEALRDCVLLGKRLRGQE